MLHKSEKPNNCWDPSRMRQKPTVLIIMPLLKPIVWPRPEYWFHFCFLYLRNNTAGRERIQRQVTKMVPGQQEFNYKA